MDNIELLLLLYIDSSVCSGEFFLKRVTLIIFILYIGFGMSESNDGETDSCTNMKSKTGEFFLLTLIIRWFLIK